MILVEPVLNYSVQCSSLSCVYGNAHWSISIPADATARFSADEYVEFEEAGSVEVCIQLVQEGSLSRNISLTLQRMDITAQCMSYLQLCLLLHVSYYSCVYYCMCPCPTIVVFIIACVHVLL